MGSTLNTGEGNLWRIIRTPTQIYDKIHQKLIEIMRATATVRPRPKQFPEKNVTLLQPEGARTEKQTKSNMTKSANSSVKQ